MKNRDDVENYLLQAESNLNFVSFLNKKCKGSEYYNWILVLLYYTSLHYFYALLRGDDKDIPTKHKSVSNDLSDRGDVDLASDILYTSYGDQIVECSGDYSTVFDWSCDVRYKPYGYSKFGNREVSFAYNMVRKVKFIVVSSLGCDLVRENGKYQLKELDNQELSIRFNNIKNIL